MRRPTWRAPACGTGAGQSLSGRLSTCWEGCFGASAQPADSFSVLDVGAASGDMGAAIRRRYPRARVTSLDYKGDHLAQAADPKLVADAFRLPFRPASFDFVFSSLFLHHFTNDQVVELFRSFRAVARRAVLAIDLDRGPLAYHFLPQHALAVRLARHHHQRRPDFGGGGVEEGRTAGAGGARGIERRASSGASAVVAIVAGCAGVARIQFSPRSRRRTRLSVIPSSGPPASA